MQTSSAKQTAVALRGNFNDAKRELNGILPTVQTSWMRTKRPSDLLTANSYNLHHIMAIFETCQAPKYPSLVLNSIFILSEIKILD